MCRPFSFYCAEINGEPKLWWSEESDSHTAIVKEHHIRDTGMVPLFAGEFYPDDESPSPDPATWILNWDSDATNASRDKPGAEFAESVRAQLERLVPRWIATSGEQVVTVRGWAWNSAQQTVNGGEGRARSEEHTSELQSR